MKKQKYALIRFLVILGVVSLACGVRINMGGTPTAAPPPTQKQQQPVAPLPTIPHKPTVAIQPQPTVAISPQPTVAISPQPTVAISPTPNPVLQPTVGLEPSNSQVPADFQQVVERYYEKAYLSSTEGEYVPLDDYSRDWAKNGYQDLTDTGQVVDNFMIRAHFAWQSATRYPDPSGCGYGFRGQGQDYYIFFVDKETVWLGIWDESSAGKFQRIGANTGNGMTGNLAEADVVLIVNQGKAVVLINENFVGTYVLDTDYLTGSGGLSYLVVSGTNKDYGTRCKMTNVDLWKIK